MGKKNDIAGTDNKLWIENKYTTKMLKKQTYFFIFLLLLAGITGFAQTLPVTISTQMNQPSPIYWRHYADAATSNSPIKIQIVLNDLTIARRQVRLKCYWQGNGISFMNNDFVVGAQPLFLEGGVPELLNNTQLAPYFEFRNLIGLTPNQYAQPIPEGIYTFSVEVYDVATGQKLSRKSNVITTIFQNDPPLLNLPLNKASIIQQNIQNIIFSWIPRTKNVSNVEYQFDLIEIFDKNTPIQNAFAYSKPIYTTTTRATTLLYGLDAPQLIPTKTYAWRIKAKAIVGAEEIGVFKNNGYSEIFSFSYDVYCTAPLQVTTDGVSQNQAKITWSGALDNFDYQVNYREKNADSQWYPLETPRENATLANLKPNTTYEYSVGASCEKGKYIHSSIQEFTTLAQDEIALVTCGIVPDPTDLSNLSPLDNLVANDVIKAGDFPIVVIEATGGNGRFSGEGYVTIPLLERYKKLIDAADNLAEIPKKAAGIVTDAATVATALANHGATQINNAATKVEDITGQTINNPTQGVTDQIKNTAALVSDKANALAGMVPDYSTNIGQYTRVAVSFSDIGVNTDFKLISGSIIASYDPEWKSMIDLDPAFNEVFGDAGNVVNYEIDFDIKTVIKNQDGSITITSKTDVVTVIDKTVNDIVITDKDGTQYTIPANAQAGPIKPSGQLAPGGVPTAANTNGMGAGGVVKQISSADVSVIFTKGDGKYAFDTAPTTQNSKLSKSYKSIPQKSGGTYSIPFKAISNRPDSTDVIVATVDFKNGKTKDDIVFKTQNGTLIKSTWNENTARLQLKRTLDYAKETVIAAVRPTPAVQQNATGSAQPGATNPIKPTDSKNSAKYDIAGTFNLWHLTHKKVNVTLVSVNGAAIPEDAAGTLNQIYEPTGITFNVNTKPIILDHFWEDTIETGNSDLLNTYTAEQQAITVALKTKLGAEYATDTYYMLYTKEGTVKKDAGFMPLKRQFGFVFDGRNKTLAHELGHGVFGLQHPFKQYGTSKGSTDLLMDYGDGTTVNHNDWEIMHAPGLQLYQFTQGSSAGASYWTVIDDKFLNLDKDPKDKTKGSFSFLSYHGEIVTLTKTNLEQILFNYGTTDYQSSGNQAPGVLHGFVINLNGTRTSYKINFNDGKYKNEKGIAYEFQDIKPEIIDGVVVFIPCGNEGKIYKFKKSDLAMFSNANSKASLTAIDEFPFVPFSANNPALETAGVKISQSFKLSDEGLRWSYDQNTVNMTKNYCEKPELFYILKIAQIRKNYPEAFDKFTDINNWENPKIITDNAGPSQGGTTIKKTFEWTYFLNRSENAKLKSDYSSNINLENYFKKMYQEFSALIKAENIDSELFWNEINKKTELQILNQIQKESIVELEKRTSEQKSTAIKVLINGIVKENKEDAIIKLIASFKQDEISKLENLLINNIGLKTLDSKFDNFLGKENFTKIMTTVAGISSPVDPSVVDSKTAIIEGKIIKVDNSIFFNKSSDAVIDSKNIKFSKDTYTYYPSSSIYSGMNYSVSKENFLNIPYNQLVFVEFASEMKFNGVNHPKGDIILVPAIVAYALINNANTEQLQKTTWLVVDGVLFATGVGEVKVFFTAGNWTRKIIVGADIAGSGVNLLLDAGLEKYLPPDIARKCRVAGLLLSIPNGLLALKDIGGPLIKEFRAAKSELKSVEQAQEFEKQIAAFEKQIDAVGSLAQIEKIAEKVPENLRKQFISDFGNSSDEIIKVLSKENSELINGWKKFRKNNPTSILCN
ncbi:fibronectin type III domain protein [Flavobacterium tiangeerense]|uniref:Fibronectin type III domain protein n=2 Tax=Flavobacterium tiangeerense TaxID=459471 RepID=A0ABY3FLC1_9FLAO|nr:fibronectin type III domain protein [Flavobacterium tiangeerense]